MNGCDLVVVGGGPAGAALAALAAERGLAVTLLERAKFPRDKVCGEFVSPEGITVLGRLGLADTLLAAGARWMDSFRLTDLAGRELGSPLPLGPLGRGGLGISRARLDLELLELARRRGVRVQESWEVLGPLVEGGRVVGVTARRVGTRSPLETLRAPLVAAADGRRSAVARALHPHLGDPAKSGPRSWFGVKAHFAVDPDRLAGRVELHLFAGGYAGLGAVEDGRVNVCFMTTVAALRACGGSPLGLLDERVRRNPALAAMIGDARPQSAWKSVGPLRFGPRRAASCGALFVGDAAGTIDPFCGEGIANALGAAELALPFVVEAAASGALDDAMAQRYARAWERGFGGMTRRARRLGWLLERPGLASPAISLLRGPGRRLLPRVVTAVS